MLSKLRLVGSFILDFWKSAHEPPYVPECTIEDILKIGDVVVLPSGNTATVIRIGKKFVSRYPVEKRRIPGTYENRSHILLRTQDGNLTLTEDSGIEMQDSALFETREQEWRKLSRSVQIQGLRLGDLPNTAFWETDIVNYHEREFVIQSIQYDGIGDEKPTYTLEDNEGRLFISIEEDEISLVQKGPLWLKSKGVKAKFDDLGKMERFYISTGQYSPVNVQYHIDGYSPQGIQLMLAMADFIQLQNPKMRAITVSLLNEALKVLESGQADIFTSNLVINIPFCLAKVNDPEDGTSLRQYSIDALKQIISLQEI